MKPSALPTPLNKRARIEPLSVLPVFVDLHGKKVIVVGDSEGAVWKAELLLQCGAQLKWICCQPNAAILQLVSDAHGKVELIIDSWLNVAFDGASLVIADVTVVEAAALAQKARAAGAWINTIDKPEFCQFQFGSIVNKSPLVIGISTSGAAPVLAQYVRSMIEASLPSGIQARVQKAANIRKRVTARLATSTLRRAYWKAFFSIAFGFSSKSEKVAEVRHFIKAAVVEDLTLRDIRALQSADHIFIEEKSDDAILQFARREAQRTAISSTNNELWSTLTSGRSVVISAGLITHEQT